MYEVTALYDMSVQELLDFAKGVTNTDLVKTKAGQFYANEAIQMARFKIEQEMSELKK